VKPITYPHPGACLTIALTLTAASLTGCDKLSSTGQSETMSLLRSGSEKVCVAPDVQQSLRDLILPKLANVGDSGSEEDKRSAIKAVALSYNMTTLQSFDKAVTKASCNTTVRVSASEAKSNTFTLNYQVSPSAENGATFVVAADTNAAHTYAGLIVNATVAEAITRREGQQQGAEQGEARASLLATVTPHWLVGSWIDPDADAAACSNGSALTFQADHSVGGRMAGARWVLTGDKLHIVGKRPTGSVDKTLTITDADAVSFKYDGDIQGAYRRCGRGEGGGPVGVTASDNTSSTCEGYWIGRKFAVAVTRGGAG